MGFQGFQWYFYKFSRVFIRIVMFYVGQRAPLSGRFA